MTEQGETHGASEKALCVWQKRPTFMAKETYLYGKRALLIWQNIPEHREKVRVAICLHPEQGRLTEILKSQRPSPSTNTLLLSL